MAQAVHSAVQAVQAAVKAAHSVAQAAQAAVKAAQAVHSVAQAVQVRPHVDGRRLHRDPWRRLEIRPGIDRWPHRLLRLHPSFRQRRRRKQILWHRSGHWGLSPLGHWRCRSRR